MIPCPECGMPQYCPCPACRRHHKQEDPFLWTRRSKCGYCGNPINDDTAWAQIEDRGLDQFYED